MGQYEERLERDLERLRKRVRRMGTAVVKAVRGATRAVLVNDAELATETILGDLPINRQARDLDEKCHVFIVRHLPSAGHLRFVSSAMRLSKTLERIGDYSETIARAAAHMNEAPVEPIGRDLELLGKHAAQLLEESLEAYDSGSVVDARATRSRIARYGPTFDRVFDSLVEIGQTDRHGIEDLYSLAAISNRLERVMHQAKNICEQTIFAVTGERKKEKTFDFLFVDTECTGASLYAVAYCRRAYPEAGTYRCVGWNAGGEPDEKFVQFADAKGLDLDTTIPATFDDIREHVSDFDLVIDLDGSVREHIKKIPFHTTLLRWPLTDRNDPEKVHQQLVSRTKDLMEILRGDDAH